MNSHLLRNVLVLLFFMLCSCSAVEKIQKNGNSIQTRAQTTRSYLEDISQAAKSSPPGLETITQRSNQGILEQTAIIEEAQGIIEATSGVKDIVPWWANTLEIVMIAVALVAVAIILWNTGIGIGIRKMIGFIPEADKEQAKLLTEVLDGNTDMREAIAMMRAKDPMLNTAFKTLKKKKEAAANAQLQTDNSTAT